MGRWYYMVQNQQRGPIELPAMQSLVQGGQIQPETLVWEEGMPQWIAAQQSGALFPQMAPMGATGMGGARMQDDPGPFWKFGNTFSRKGAGEYFGTIVASPTAFYILKLRRNNAAAHGVGGLVGALVVSAMQHDDDVRTCGATDLPQNIRMQLDPKGKNVERDVIILPRAAVSMVKTSFWTGFNITCGQDIFRISPRAFRGGAARAWLTANGWKINEPMQPTAMPIHGAGLNRPAGTVPPRQMGAMKRIGLILLAIIILIVVVVILAVVGK